MGLLSDLYNTVAKFFRPQEEPEGEASKSVATNRLKLVLMQDRTNLTPRILEQMRSELIELLSRYVELDKELLELNFEQEENQVALMLSIPVIRAKDEDEIDAAIKAHQERLMEEAARISPDDADDDSECSEDNMSEIEDTETIDNESEALSDEQPEEKVEKSKISTPDDMTSAKQQESAEVETEEVSTQ